MIVIQMSAEKRFICNIAMMNGAQNILIDPWYCFMSDPTFHKGCMLIPNVCELRLETIYYIIFWYVSRVSRKLFSNCRSFTRVVVSRPLKKWNCITRWHCEALSLCASRTQNVARWSAKCISATPEMWDLIL